MSITTIILVALALVFVAFLIAAYLNDDEDHTS